MQLAKAKLEAAMLMQQAVVMEVTVMTSMPRGS